MINIVVIFDLGIVGLESINNHLHDCHSFFFFGIGSLLKDFKEAFYEKKTS